MIQDIAPSVFHNEYTKKDPSADDYVFIFNEKEILVKDEAEGITCPKVSDIGKDKLQFLFTLNDSYDYLYLGNELLLPNGFHYENVKNLRHSPNKLLAFAGMTAYHLYIWYKNNRFCGRCGAKTIIYNKERALKCPLCDNIIYPRISPAVIVAVTNGDQIIITRYSGREYKGLALIAGFCEIGETAEETVAREVMEEVGLKVKNIRYYKSQPWGFDSNLLLGFYCELDGNSSITMDTSELKTAKWIKKEDLEEDTEHVSLTSEMMMAFKHNNYPL